jgi:hypothetical protein
MVAPGRQSAEANMRLYIGGRKKNGCRRGAASPSSDPDRRDGFPPADSPAPPAGSVRDREGGEVRNAGGDLFCFQIDGGRKRFQHLAVGIEVYDGQA